MAAAENSLRVVLSLARASVMSGGRTPSDLYFRRLDAAGAGAAPRMGAGADSMYRILGEALYEVHQCYLVLETANQFAVLGTKDALVALAGDERTRVRLISQVAYRSLTPPFSRFQALVADCGFTISNVYGNAAMDWLEQIVSGAGEGAPGRYLPPRAVRDVIYQMPGRDQMRLLSLAAGKR